MATTTVSKMLPYMVKTAHPHVDGAFTYQVPSHHIWIVDGIRLFSIDTVPREGTYYLNREHNGFYIEDYEPLIVETSIIVPMNLF